MSKYRIVERTHPDGRRKWVVQCRFLWWWYDFTYDCNSLDEAQMAYRNLTEPVTERVLDP